MVKAPTSQVVIEKIKQWQEVARQALELEDAIKDALDADEVAKQTWADLETDWPHDPAASHNVLNADGKVVVPTRRGQDVKSFSGTDINQCKNRLRDIYDYLNGAAGPLTIPPNANRDINRLTIDD